MTRVFTTAGSSVPVTVVEVAPNRVTRRTGGATEGYAAVQIAWGSKRRSLINKPMAGMLAAAEIESAAGLAEFRLDAGEGTEDRKSTRLNSSHIQKSRMPSSA